MFKRNKGLFTLLLVIVLTFSLVGCGGQQAAEEASQTSQEQSEGLQDGKYLVKYDVSSHGNFPMAVMEVENGEITSFDYQEYLANSGKTKNPETYDYEPTTKVIPSLNKQFMEEKDLEKVDFDAVSGATHTKDHFKEAVKDLMEKAKAGDTYQPEYEDGVYTAKAEEASHGWLGEIKLVVKHGQIVGADYNEVAVEDTEGEKVVFDDEGNPVKEDGENKTKTVQIKKGDVKSKDNYKYLPAIEAMQSFEYQIINNNGPTNMNYDAVSGATHTKDRIVKLAEKALSEAKK